jgi:hypothetical protein
MLHGSSNGSGRDNLLRRKQQRAGVTAKSVHIYHESLGQNVRAKCLQRIWTQRECKGIQTLGDCSVKAMSITQVGSGSFDDKREQK